MAQEALDPSARFKRLKEEAKRETTAQTQQAQEALKRRFAALGLQSSGAAIKQEQLAQQAGQTALQRRLGDIQSAQESEQLRRQEIEEGRQFARSEREASQAFGSEQAQLQRAFQTGERTASQQFGAEQALLGREFAKAERLSQQDFAALQNKIQREFASDEALKQRGFTAEQAQLARDLQAEQFASQLLFQRESRDIQQSQFAQQMDLAIKQFNLDEEITRYNQALADAEASKKTIFDRLGQYGTNFFGGLQDIFTGGGVPNIFG